MLLIHAAAIHIDEGRSLNDLPAAWGAELGLGSSWGAIDHSFSVLPDHLPDTVWLPEDGARHGFIRDENRDEDQLDAGGEGRRPIRGVQHNLTIVGPYTICTLCGRRSVRPRKFATLPCHKKAPEQAPAHGTSLASKGGHDLVVDWNQEGPRVKCNCCHRSYKWSKRLEFGYCPCRGSAVDRALRDLDMTRFTPVYGDDGLRCSALECDMCHWRCAWTRRVVALPRHRAVCPIDP